MDEKTLKLVAAGVILTITVAVLMWIFWYIGALVIVAAVGGLVGLVMGAGWALGVVADYFEERDKKKRREKEDWN